MSSGSTSAADSDAAALAGLLGDAVGRPAEVESKHKQLLERQEASAAKLSAQVQAEIGQRQQVLARAEEQAAAERLAALEAENVKREAEHQQAMRLSELEWAKRDEAHREALRQREQEAANQRAEADAAHRTAMEQREAATARKLEQMQTENQRWLGKREQQFEEDCPAKEERLAALAAKEDEIQEPVVAMRALAAAKSDAMQCGRAAPRVRPIAVLAPLSLAIREAESRADADFIVATLLEAGMSPRCCCGCARDC